MKNLEFLDKQLPMNLETAIKHVEKKYHKLLDAYDKYVLGSYEISTELDHMLNHNLAFFGMQESVIDNLVNTNVSPEKTGRRLIRHEKGREFRKYVTRNLFVYALEKHWNCESISAYYSSVPAGYVLAKAYLLLSEMILQSVRKKK